MRRVKVDQLLPGRLGNWFASWPVPFPSKAAAVVRGADGRMPDHEIARMRPVGLP